MATKTYLPNLTEEKNNIFVDETRIKKYVRKNFSNIDIIKMDKSIPHCLNAIAIDVAMRLCEATETIATRQRPNQSDVETAVKILLLENERYAEILNSESHQCVDNVEEGSKNSKDRKDLQKQKIKNKAKSNKNKQRTNKTDKEDHMDVDQKSHENDDDDNDTNTNEDDQTSQKNDEDDSNSEDEGKSLRKEISKLKKKPNNTQGR